MPVYHIQPQDLLFFRDARPMESQSPGGGHGANWPHPGVFFDALHAALWRAFPDPSTVAGLDSIPFEDHSYFRKRDGRRTGDPAKRTYFQTLATAGPFPVRGSEWFFPAPADAQPGGLSLPLDHDAGASDLPPPLRYPVVANALPSKESLHPWWSKTAWEQYLLHGALPCLPQAIPNADLFAAEWTTGIGTNPLTGTQDGERIYSAEYLRLQESVRLGLWATLPEGIAREERLHRLFPDTEAAAQPTLIIGGQQRVCRVRRVRDIPLGQCLPVSQGFAALGTRVKWVLLSPALFPASKTQDQRPHPGGWLPTWIDPGSPDVPLADDPRAGTVLLRPIRTKPRTGEPVHRSERRSDSTQSLLGTCRLVAACVPKPIVVTGWTEACHVPEPTEGDTLSSGPLRRGPRETRLAVPAGAVYYFECRTPEAARELWTALSWHGSQGADADAVLHRRSSLRGEKGFGLGVCGPWDPFPAPRPTSPSTPPGA